MATFSITNFELTLLDDSVFTLINNLAKQHKRTNLDKIYNEFIKMVVSENTSKEHVYDRINKLIIQEKIISKPNRNDDSYLANESIVDFNIDQLEYSILLLSNLSFATSNTKLSSPIDLVNHTIPETPNLPHQDINSKESVRIIESEKFTDIIFEKMKIENSKTEIISSLKLTIFFLFQKEFNTLKDKCEKLMQNSYSDYKGQIDNLRKEIEKKDEIISKLSATLNNITNNLPLKEPNEGLLYTTVKIKMTVQTFLLDPPILTNK